MGERIKSYKELRVFENAMNSAMKIFERTKTFPPEEKYSMVDQMRRSSRSVCANIGEAWRKRRYKAAFIAKLSDMEDNNCAEMDTEYDQIMGQIVKMINEADKWIIR
jgi:hypothetical protein